MTTNWKSIWIGNGCHLRAAAQQRTIFRPLCTNHVPHAGTINKCNTVRRGCACGSNRASFSKNNNKNGQWPLKAGDEPIVRMCMYACCSVSSWSKRNNQPIDVFFFFFPLIFFFSPHARLKEARRLPHRNNKTKQPSKKHATVHTGNPATTYQTERVVGEQTPSINACMCMYVYFFITFSHFS